MARGSSTAPKTTYISAEVQGLDNVIQSLDPKLAAKVAMRTLNKVGAKAITAAKRSITDSYTIKYSNLQVESIKARLDNAVFTIKCKSRRREMSKHKYYRAKQRSWGVEVEVQKGKIEQIPHAFIAKHTRGGTNVYLRGGKSDPKRVKRRSPIIGKYYMSQLPITASLGPSPAQLLKLPSSMRAIMQVVRADFNPYFKSQLSYEMYQAYKRNISRGAGA